MPIHDWSRLKASAFHGFHGRWITFLTGVLNKGLLPPGYLADGEQVASQGEDRINADLVTLRRRPTGFDGPAEGGTALAVDPKTFAETRVPRPDALPLPRRLVVRESRNYDLVAVLEIVSPANRDRPESVNQFAVKIDQLLGAGVHVMLIDLFASGRHDPDGMHGAVLGRIAPDEPYTHPDATARTVASYGADSTDFRVLVARPRLGEPLPDTPLSLAPDRYVIVPLEQTYLQAYDLTATDFQERLEAP